MTADHPGAGAGVKTETGRVRRPIQLLLRAERSGSVG
jgi:hypothetical protein